MTLTPRCEKVETAHGVPLTVTGVAQVKIMRNTELLQTASEQFLGKHVDEIKETILQTLEGHLRAILGTLTVEEIYKDRERFAKEVNIFDTKSLLSIVLLRFNEYYSYLCQT